MKQSGFKRLIRPEDVECSAYVHQAWIDTQLRIDQKFEVNPKWSQYSHLLNLPPVLKLLDKFVGEFGTQMISQKSATKSTKYRNLANLEYGGKRLSDALYLYTFAILYAPDVSEGNAQTGLEELSLALENRSAVFFELGHYDACLVDIEHAQAAGYPPVKSHKLLLRKVECLMALDRFLEAKKLWNDHHLEHKVSNDDKRGINIRLKLMKIDNFETKIPEGAQSSISSINTMLPVIDHLKKANRYEPSVDLPSKSAQVEIQSCPKKGRHMVAKGDIEAGDIVTVEAPFASLLYRQNELHFCHHCCRSLEMNMPNSKGFCIAGPLVACSQCTRVLYCSASCRTESWQKYHRYECSILPFLYATTNNNSHLAFRIILSTGIDVIRHVTSTNINGQAKYKHTKLETDSLFFAEKSALYQQVCRLIDHSDRIQVSDLRSQTITANLFMYLAIKIGFIRTTEEAILCGTSFLRHYFQLNYNYHILRPYVPSGGGDEGAFEIVPTGFGIYPTSSLVCHSCEANVNGSTTLGSLLIQRATKAIAAGDELCISYDGYSFVSYDLTERRKQLSKYYYFECHCSRCELEDRDGLAGKYYPIGCAECGFALIRKSSTSGSFYCPNSKCRNQVETSLSEMRALYHQIQIQLFKSTMHAPGCGEHLINLERQLVQLTSISGMHNFCGLLNLYAPLCAKYESTSVQSSIDKARVYRQKSCLLEQMYRGTTLNLCYTFIGLAKLCLNSEAHLKRAIQLLRLFLLIDCDNLSFQPVGLMDEFARHLWQMHQSFVEHLQMIQMI